MSLREAVVETRLPAQDLERARRWYADKLGLDPIEERPGGLRYQCADGVFCLFQSTGQPDASFTQMSFNVKDIDAEATDLQARGVVLEQYDIPGSTMRDGLVDIDGNYPSKGTGERAAWFRDSEGNLIGIGQAQP